MTRPTYSEPLNSLQLIGSFVRLRISRRADRFLYKISYINEHLPEPETPVMTFRQPSGTSPSMFLMLNACPPRTIILPFASRRLADISIFSSPRRYAKVNEFDVFFLAVNKSSK